MPRVEDITNRIHRALSGYAGKVPADADDMAREYAAAVDEVNRRLERCVVLLRKGLRSDAIHQAEIAPPVLEEAIALDFLQRPQWLAICQEHGLDVAAEVNADAVSELNEAFPREQQVSRLLQSHRRLALGRGPLRLRISVLRKLSQADPENPIWGDDLAILERERHRQIALEAAAAVNRRDLISLESLDKECREVWLEKPPGALIESVKKLCAKARAEYALMKLTALEPRLADACSKRDHKSVEQLLKDWERYAKLIEAVATRPVSQSVEEAKGWLAKHQHEAAEAKAYQRALTALELGLDNSRTSGEEIERLWAAAVKFERPMPQVLQTRYASRRSERRIESARRFRLRFAGVIGCVLLLGAIIGAVTYWGIRYREAGRWRTQIAAVVEQERWSEAQAIVDRLAAQDQAILSRPDIQSLVSRLKEGSAEEAGRRQRFEAAITQAGEADPGHPDAPALERAAQLARAPDEKLRVDQIRDRVQKLALTSQKGRDEAFSSALDAVRARFTELRDQAGNPNSDARGALQKVKVDLSGLLTQPKISPPIQASGRVLLSSVDAVLGSAEDKVKRAEAIQATLAEIRKLHNDSATLAKKLKDFAEKFPESPFAGDFQAAADLTDGWRSAELWTELGPDPLAQLRDPSKSSSNEEWLAKTLEQCPHGVYAAFIPQCQAYARRASFALAPENAPDMPKGDLLRLFTHPMVDGLSILTTRTGRKFYVTKAPRVRPGAVEFEYIATVAQAFGKETLKSAKMPPSDFDGNPVIRAAPQSQFAEKARKLIRERKGDWENLHLSLCQQLALEKEIDPIVRIMMALELARLVRERDWMVHPELETWVRRMDQVKADVNWMDPDDEDAARARRVAADAFAPTPDFEQLLRRLDDWKQQIKTRKPIGLIWRESDKKLSLTTPPEQLQDGRLEVAVGGPEKGWTFQPLADIKNRQPKFDSRALQQPAGSVVYWTAP